MVWLLICHEYGLCRWNWFFLDQQAARLNIPIEQFGELALKSKNPVRIAGRCAVFAESDMVHKQQLGHSVEDIIAGLCEALVT